MQEIEIAEVRPQEKGRVSFRFENGAELVLYRSEIRALTRQEEQMLLRGNGVISGELYQKLMGIVTLRAKKRAMHLLEQMDRTEYQLREKLRRNGYPEEGIESAVDYVKQFRYVDDLRYAKSFVRYQQEKKSRQRLTADLMRRGVPGDLIAQALEEEFAADETEQIREWLKRRHYDEDGADEKTRRRTYQFLMRKGFKSSDILGVMSGRK